MTNTSPRFRSVWRHGDGVAGYSSRPLIQKLGVKPSTRVLLAGPPEAFASKLGQLPEGVKLVTPSAKEFDFALLFITRAKELGKIAALGQRMVPDGALWVAWPKKSAKPDTEISEDMVRKVALDLGLVDVKVIAIDEYWSGLKLVYRLKNRPKP